MVSPSLAAALHGANNGACWGARAEPTAMPPVTSLHGRIRHALALGQPARNRPGSAQVRQGGGGRARNHELGLELVSVAAIGRRAEVLPLGRHLVLAQHQRAPLVRQLQALCRALRAHKVDRHLDA